MLSGNDGSEKQSNNTSIKTKRVIKKTTDPKTFYTLPNFPNYYVYENSKGILGKDNFVVSVKSLQKVFNTWHSESGLEYELISKMMTTPHFLIIDKQAFDEINKVRMQKMPNGVDFNIAPTPLPEELLPLLYQEVTTRNSRVAKFHTELFQYSQDQCKNLQAAKENSERTEMARVLASFTEAKSDHSTNPPATVLNQTSTTTTTTTQLTNTSDTLQSKQQTSVSTQMIMTTLADERDMTSAVTPDVRLPTSPQTDRSFKNMLQDFSDLFMGRMNKLEQKVEDLGSRIDYVDVKVTNLSARVHILEEESDNKKRHSEGSDTVSKRQRNV